MKSARGKGKSTVWLGKGSKDSNNVKIYAIDPHTGSPEHKKWYGKVRTLDEFKENIKRAEVDDVVVPIVKTSEEAAKNWNKPVEFLFVDGAHEYIYVSLDYKLWEPHLVEGGIIAFHDTIAGSPKKVVDKYIYKSKKFKNVGFVYSISFGIKTNENSLIDRAKNSYVWLLRYIYTGLRAEIAIGKIRCKLKTKRRPKILYALITASQRIPIAMRIIAEAFQSKHS